jgi:hypothetical protein
VDRGALYRRAGSVMSNTKAIRFLSHTFLPPLIKGAQGLQVQIVDLRKIHIRHYDFPGLTDAQFPARAIFFSIACICITLSSVLHPNLQEHGKFFAQTLFRNKKHQGIVLIK